MLRRRLFSLTKRTSSSLLSRTYKELEMLPLKEFEGFIKARYERRLGIALQIGAISADLPSWVHVDTSNFLKVVRGDSDAGVLLDPEIGLAIFVVVYRGGDLQADFVNALAVSSRLLTARPSDRADPNGGWRVGVMWLIESSCEAA